MNDLIDISRKVPAMTSTAIAKVSKLEELVASVPQASIETDHVLHGGIYTRTIMIPAGVVLTGALVKVPTTLVISGSVRVSLGDRTIDLHGYNVLPASAGRKQAFMAFEDTYLTMSFATKAETIGEAEEQFTDDAHRLMSRSPDHRNTISITGE